MIILKPKIIQIEITNRCNFNCKMCPRRFLGVEYKDMSFELFKKIINQLKGVYEIVLTGWGEPFIHPQIIEMLKYCSDFGFKTRLTTNGALLNDNMSDRIIESGLDKITFSIDSLNGNEFGHLIESQIENIKNLARKEKRPEIIIQTTIHKNKENDIFEIIKFAKEIKAQKINLVRLDTRFNPNLIRPDFNQEKEIVEKAVEKGDKIGVKVECFHHSLSRGLLRKIFKLSKNTLDKQCFKLFNQAYINVNGDLTPCCSLPNYKIGSILEEPIKDIWKNKKFQHFRKNWSRICSSCDAGTIFQHPNHPNL